MVEYIFDDKSVDENNEFMCVNKRYGFPPVTTEIRVAQFACDEPTLFVNWIKVLFKRKQ